MIDLILSVCMVSSPESCKEQHLYYESRGSLAQCMMLSMPYVAQWAGDHPEWKISGWTCNWPDKRKQPV